MAHPFPPGNIFIKNVIRQMVPSPPPSTPASRPHSHRMVPPSSLSTAVTVSAIHQHQRNLRSQSKKAKKLYRWHRAIPAEYPMRQRNHHHRSHGSSSAPIAPQPSPSALSISATSLAIQKRKSCPQPSPPMPSNIQRGSATTTTIHMAAHHQRQ